LWKPVGDELIYTAEVRSEHDVCVLVDAWIKAMRATEEIVLAKAAMDLKGAAWIATFPLPDRAIAVPMDPSIYERDLEPEVINRELLSRFDGGEQEKVRVDYLGPSIDLGFRVASRATARRFMLSFEAA
jgi:hypothetical protein